MVTDKTSQSCWRVNNGFWRFLRRDACREDKHNEAPDGSERGQKGSGRASRRASTRLPPCCIGEFSRRVSRVGNLPSDEKKVVCPTVVLRFFQQITHLRLDACHEKRGKWHMAN